MSKLLSKDTIPAQGCFIDNEYRNGTGPSLTLINPKDASKINEFAEASESDVDAAVASALKAFKSGEWSQYTGVQRARCLYKLADLIDENGEELAYYESLASGRPVSVVLRGDIPRVSGVFRYYAGWADKVKGDSYPPDGDGFYKIVEQKPLGVCGGIIAWNGSLHFLSWKSAPALATGNTVVIKPSEKSPLGSLAFGHLIKAAGFPPGAFNLIVGGRTAGSVMSAHMDIAKISFTGSTATGKAISAAATKSNMKRVTLELGGKSPALVFDDANLDNATFWATIGFTGGTGQVCAATTRLYVQEGIADEFIGRLKDSIAGMNFKLGMDPQDPKSTYGPIVDKDQYEKVTKFIEEGKKNASIIAGGETYGEKGYYVSPVIFKDPDNDAAIYKEEIFGPVLCVKTFKTEEEALELANDTRYGLSGAVYTSSISRALRVAGKVEGGTICINCTSMVGPQIPMGGFKNSGQGRELGEYALRHYTDTRALWINMNA